ncbi:acyltransferase family protein [Dongia soli]|uniref:Acyltransferase n=1 Tax=Dongia soli TaxID=600628 RepID=A0ABU5EEB1_9PROT|nr:acyltransferase [Dongia soli]MDY0884642.1 acyltransferase [Dongia soli]
MSDVSKSANRDKFGCIEVGRGIAALLVVFHHTGSIMAEPRFFNAEPFGGHFRNFNVGVDFFFVLSGFIITWIHWNDIGLQDRIGAFAAKRFVRIFPSYWFILFPLIILYLVVTSAGQPSQRDPVNIVLSILLLPYTAQPVLGVAWTLTHEIFFYALFAVIIWGGRRALMILPIWAVAILAANILEARQAIAPLAYPFSFFLSPFDLEFIMGVGAAIVLRHARIPAPWLVAGTGVVMFLSFMWFFANIQDISLVGRLAFGTAATLFVLGVVEIERVRPLKLPKFLLALGAASYAVYLVHSVELSFSINLSSRFGLSTYLSLDTIALGLALVAAAFGIAYHYVIEVRLIKFTRNIMGPRRRDPIVDRSPVPGSSVLERAMSAAEPEQKISGIEP